MFVCKSIGLCVLCVCKCMCESNQSTSKNHVLCVISKFKVLLHITHSKVLLILWYQGSTSLETETETFIDSDNNNNYKWT